MITAREYTRDGDGVEAVASELYSGWIEKNSKSDEYPRLRRIW